MKVLWDIDRHDGVGSLHSGHAGVPQIDLASDQTAALSASQSMAPGHERDTLVRVIADQTARIAELELALSLQISENAALLRDATGKPSMARVAPEAAVAIQESRIIGDLAAVTRLLREKEDDAEWLRKVAATLLGDSRRGALISLLPGPLGNFLRNAQLKRRDLFDASTYRAANPDVASARIDALRHYIIHGIREGRARR